MKILVLCFLWVNNYKVILIIMDASNDILGAIEHLKHI